MNSCCPGYVAYGTPLGGVAAYVNYLTIIHAAYTPNIGDTSSKLPCKFEALYLPDRFVREKADPES